MTKASSAFFNSKDIGFKIIQDGIVQVSLGSTHVCMTLDSAFDLQYHLASFLADLELMEYPLEREDEASGIMEGRQTLEALAAYPKGKRLDA